MVKLHGMDKMSYLNIYAQYLDIDKIWQLLFDILTLETVKTKLYSKNLHNKKMDWKSVLFFNDR